MKGKPEEDYSDNSFQGKEKKQKQPHISCSLPTHFLAFIIVMLEVQHNALYELNI